MFKTLLKTSGILFNSEGSTKESAFCPVLVFRNMQITFRYLITFIQIARPLVSTKLQTVGFKD